jgi:hypothetical protein
MHCEATAVRTLATIIADASSRTRIAILPGALDAIFVRDNHAPLGVIFLVEMQTICSPCWLSSLQRRHVLSKSAAANRLFRRPRSMERMIIFTQGISALGRDIPARRRPRTGFI